MDGFDNFLYKNSDIGLYQLFHDSKINKLIEEFKKIKQKYNKEKNNCNKRNKPYFRINERY